MLIVYVLILGLLSLYSYALVDPNFTLVNHQLWEIFRNSMVQLGYYQRPLSLAIFLSLIVALSFFNWYFTQKKIEPVKLAMIIAAVLLVSYPFLSHDFFNYLFDAKILTFYGQNPYLHKALDFPQDSWLRFMHWTHRTYPYGPGFLLLSLVPSFFSFGKLLLAFIFFKAMFAFFYVMAVWSLNKFNRQTALFFATSPLVIIEGLVNNHNDFLAVSFGLLAVYFLHKKKQFLPAGILALFSVGIKYVTLAFVPLIKKSWQAIGLSVLGFSILLWYMYLKVGIHPWYLLNLLIILPFLKKKYVSFGVLSFGLLLSYYPYILFGGWDLDWKVLIKERVIFVTLLLFLISLFLKQFFYFIQKMPFSQK